MAKGISTPQFLVNNEPIAIIPNTLKYTEGKGVTTTRATSTGGGGIEYVTTTNAEEFIGKVSVEIANTAENIKLARGWKNNPGKNGIRINEGSFSRVFTEMSIANEYEVELSTEGKLSLEWEGGQAQ